MEVLEPYPAVWKEKGANKPTEIDQTYKYSHVKKKNGCYLVCKTQQCFNVSGLHLNLLFQDWLSYHWMTGYLRGEAVIQLLIALYKINEESGLCQFSIHTVTGIKTWIVCIWRTAQTIATSDTSEVWIFLKTLSFDLLMWANSSAFSCSVSVVVGLWCWALQNKWVWETNWVSELCE